MGKQVNTYRNYSTSDLKTRASIPSSTDIVEQTGYIDCSNISLNSVKTLIGASTFSLYDIARHANVNQWSGFSPRVLSYNNSGTLSATLSNTAPTICKLGDFAGYNHNASAPAMSTSDSEVWVNEGSAATITCSGTFGELIYPTANGIALTLWDGASYAGIDLQDISTLKESFAFAAVTTSALYTQTTYTGKLYITDSSSSFESNGSNCLCKVPNISDFTCTVKIRTASSGANNMSGWTVSGFGINLTNGTVGFSDAYINQDYSYIEIVATLTTDNLGSYSNITIYSGPYTSGTHLGTLEADFGGPFGNYGYHFSIAVNEPS